MKVWMHTLLAALLLCPALAAAASASEPTATTGLRWQLQQLHGSNLAPGDERPHLLLTPPGRLGGHSGCNTLNGSYLLEGGKLSFAPLLSTRVSCEQDALEADFLRALGSSRRWRAMGDQWLLLDEEGNIVAVLKLQR